MQRLNHKKANLVLDLEELQAGINFFTNRIVNIYNEENVPTDDTSKEVKSKTSDKKDT